MTTVKNIYEYINSIAPFDSQTEWDNSGLLIGGMEKIVQRAVMALDASQSVCSFAADMNADMLITHHPVIFRTLSNIASDSAVYTCVNKDIAVLSAHTNFDKSPCGINRNLALLLGLEDIHFIENSFIAVGSLDCEMSIDDFAVFVRDTLNVKGLRYTDTEKPVKTVAVGGGACEEYIELAMQNADCFLTGDMKYHDFFDAAENGYPIISAGHFETESSAFGMLLPALKERFPDVEFIWAEQKNPILAV